jgi:hypothetical protein
MLTHRARLSPLQAPTEWSLDGGVLTEKRGRRVRRFQLANLKRLDVIARPRRAVRLLFKPLSAVVIPADSFVSILRHESGMASFDPLLAGLIAEGAQASPKARMVPVAPGPAAAVLTSAAILALVAVAFAGLSIPLHAARIGLDLGARMLFGAILLMAIHPWLGREAPALLSKSPLLSRPASCPQDDETFI